MIVVVGVVAGLGALNCTIAAVGDSGGILAAVASAKKNDKNKTVFLHG